MGVVLDQNNHPISFYNKMFCPRLQRSSMYVQELHEITYVVRKWWHYLLGNPFTIIIDHKSLKKLFLQVLQTLEQQLHLVKLLRYDYKIQYRLGAGNVAANALSWSSAQGLYLILCSQFYLLRPVMHFTSHFCYFHRFEEIDSRTSRGSLGFLGPPQPTVL